MRANPGGTIGPKDVIGRDVFIEELWQILENQNLVLTSERRIGKTCVIRKMKEDVSDPNVFCVLRDLEGLRSPQEFVECIYHDVEGILSRSNRAFLKIEHLLSKIGGAQIGDIKLPHIAPHWKNLLSALMEDLCSSEKRRIVFFWDELPLFINNVKKTTGETTAMEVLDTVRSLRQRHGHLRMVFTGSVGLHLIITDLRRAGYANDPTNDMRIEEVPPLEQEDGTELARLLIAGEGLGHGSNPVRLASCISEVVGHIPYYIHCLVARMKAEGGSINIPTIEKCLHSLISDPNDPAHFRYYRTRLSTYYKHNEERIALAALDALASAQEPLPFGQLLNLIRHQMPTADEEPVREVLHLLQRDHYLARREKDGGYEFRYPIVRRWWNFDRS